MKKLIIILATIVVICVGTVIGVTTCNDRTDDPDDSNGSATPAPVEPFESGNGFFGEDDPIG